MDESYLEKCIQALPPAEQPAARAAFKSITETGDENLISKLLVTLRATGAYAATIPVEITRAGEALLRELDERNARTVRAEAEAEKQREERLRQLIAAQVPQLGKQLSLDKVVAGLTTQTAELGRIQRQLVRLRQARVGGLLLVLLLGATVGAGGVVGGFWNSYHAAQQAGRFVRNLNAAGIYAKISPAESGVCLTIESARAQRGTAWRKDAQGYIVGADFFLPIGGDR
jgi:hypothetical protein